MVRSDLVGLAAKIKIWSHSTRVLQGGSRPDAMELQKLSECCSELYDLEADYDEIVSLAGNPKHRKVPADLQARLRKFQNTPSIRGFSNTSMNESD
ncbi:MAG: hypothetical protein L0387_36150 [Acidobacteria bacterium]|nr:hypothetical protein [Acidobacteriota bacterium]MCI0722139.1 hypothetical protein [Acidobacteriota bacterium]